MGGKWEKINENLECISKLKEKHNFRFILHFVVQKDNYHEMEDIIQLGKKYNADRVWMSRIHDWNTFADFTKHNIFDTKHPLHLDFKKTLTRIEQLVETSKNSIVESATLKQLH